MAVWEDEAIPPFHFNITFTQCQTNATVAGTGSTPSPPLSESPAHLHKTSFSKWPLPLLLKGIIELIWTEPGKDCVGESDIDDHFDYFAEYCLHEVG